MHRGKLGKYSSWFGGLISIGVYVVFLLFFIWKLTDYQTEELTTKYVNSTAPVRLNDTGIMPYLEFRILDDDF